MLIKIDPRQLGAVLAGLRLLQAHADDGYENPNILQVFDDGRTPEPLDSDAIETLCQGLADGGLIVDEGDVAEIEARWTERAAVQGYAGEQRQVLATEFFVGVMAARHAAGMDRWSPPKWCIALMSGRPIDGAADD